MPTHISTVKMLAEIVSETPELIDMVSSSPENGSEIDSNQNEKKGSFSNLKKQIASLKKKQKKTLLATLIVMILLIDLLYKIFTKKKGIISPRISCNVYSK